MAEIKGIDVSAWNGDIDWKTVADYGMGFAILRITEKDNVVDKTFEQNYEGCTTNKIPVGVYKYSYATNVEEIKKEATEVIKTLNKRKLDFPVFLDLEDKCQESLSEELMMDMIDAFRDEIICAGYKFGIYCGKYWYDSKLPHCAKRFDCWLAAYPADDDGTLQERLRPEEGIGWQYSSKATIPGIPTKVDRNVFYKTYTDEEPQGGNEVSTATIQDAKDLVLSIAKGEVGYLEKASNSQLDSKTANAGYNNYTKYWRDVYPAYQAQAWCAAFVTWCFDRAFGKENTKKLLKHYPYVYCPTLGSLFTKYANPEVGDIVIFYRNGTFAHTGLVTKVSGDYFETVEGNTSSGSTIVPNGGGVYNKSYYNSNLPGTKFCRIDWDYAAKCMTSGSKEYLSNGDVGEDVRRMQTMLNKMEFDCGDADGEFGLNTENALKRFQQAYALTVDGQYGVNSKKALEAAYEAITGSQGINSDSKGLCIANKSLIGRVSPNGSHVEKYAKGTWIIPFARKKDDDGRWWFASRHDGRIQWFSSTGFNGWLKDTNGWWYLLKGYKWYKSEWRRIRGLWYEFRADGYMKHDCWSTYKGRKRYLKSDGSMAHGETLTIDGEQYKFEEGGGVTAL